MKINDKLAVRMALLRVSQSELSRRTGISQSTISGWYRGKGIPNADQVIKLARALDCEVKELLSDEEDVFDEEEKAAS